MEQGATKDGWVAAVVLEALLALLVACAFAAHRVWVPVDISVDVLVPEFGDPIRWSRLEALIRGSSRAWMVASTLQVVALWLAVRTLARLAHRSFAVPLALTSLLTALWPGVWTQLSPDNPLVWVLLGVALLLASFRRALEGPLSRVRWLWTTFVCAFFAWVFPALWLLPTGLFAWALLGRERGIVGPRAVRLAVLGGFLAASIWALGLREFGPILLRFLYLWSWTPPPGELAESLLRSGTSFAWLFGAMPLAISGWHHAGVEKHRDRSLLALAAVLISCAYAIEEARWPFQCTFAPLALAYSAYAIASTYQSVRTDAWAAVRLMLRATVAAAGAIGLLWSARDLPTAWLIPSDSFDHVDAVLVLSGDPFFNRTRRAAVLVKEGKADFLIVTGKGWGEDDNEILAAEAIRLGVPPDKILHEEKSTTTFENISFSQPIIEEMKFGRVAVVTTSCHQRRATLVARRTWGDGVEVLSAPVYEDEWCPRRGWYASEDARGRVLEEYLKILLYWRRGWL